MKYWNKDKKIRLKHWTCIDRPHVVKRVWTSNGGMNIVQTAVSDGPLLKQWCQQQPSTGKFYNYYASFRWWFEKPEDAVLFSLKWCR